jgi:hypothetical protein
MPKRDLRTSSAAHCRLKAVHEREQSVRHPACTDLVSQQICAGFRKASRHLNLRGIRPEASRLRDNSAKDHPVARHLASVKESERSRTKPLEDIPSRSMSRITHDSGSYKGPESIRFVNPSITADAPHQLASEPGRCHGSSASLLVKNNSLLFPC